MNRARFLAAALVGFGPIVGPPHATRTDPSREPHMQVLGLSLIASGDAILASDRSSSATTPGLVRIYRRSGNGAWAETGKLVGPDGPTNVGFGASLAADGTTLLVGISADSNRGGVLVYKKSGDTWTPSGRLPGSAAARSNLGIAMAIDGDNAFATASGEGIGGVVHVYHRDGSGNWQETGTLTSTTDATSGGDRFGASIAASGDRVAVGAPGRGGRGAVYIFRRDASGKWAQEGSVLVGKQAVPNATGSTTANPAFGSTILFDGTHMIAGATAANSNTGLVVQFELDAKGNWVEKSTYTPYEAAPNGFGRSLAMIGDELWVGAPTNAGNTGAVFRLRKDKTGVTQMTRLTADSLGSPAQFGLSMAAGQGVVAIAAPTDGGGDGTLLFYTRTSNNADWTLRNRIFVPPATALAAVTGAEVKCANGKANAFECGNTGLLSFLPISAIGGTRGTRLSGMWGWTDPQTGKDYALIGRTDATAFVDVTDPLKPIYLGDLPRTAGSPATSWREIKTYKNFMLVVSDGSGDHHGIQFFDLTHLRTVKTPQHFNEDSHYDLGSIHDIVVNEGSGFAYAVGSASGGETCGGGLHMVDIHDPLHPKFAGCFADKETGQRKTGYTHDAQCVMYHGPDTRYTGHEICIAANETHVSIQDVTDKSNVKVLAHATYPDVGYAHQGWFSEDQRYWFFDDELDEMGGKGKAAEGSRTLVWDFAKLDDPIMAKEFVGTTKAIDHNQYVKGNRLYQSNYTAGLRILDITDPLNLREVGFLDTHPGDNATSFAGTWSNYPYFKNGAIGVVSIGEGFFLVKDRTTIVP